VIAQILGGEAELIINPNLMMRLSCRGINDVATFRVGPQKNEDWVVFACNDGYLKVFSL